MNLVLEIGNLTRDPELKYIQKGQKQDPVVRFSIAVNRRYTDAEGNKIADYFNVVAWRGLAEQAAKYLTKGKKVSVKGELRSRTYQKDGITHYAVEIEAQEIEFLTPKNAQQQDQQPQQPPQAPQPQDDENGYIKVDEEELPF